MKIKGYKASYNGVCKGHKYEVGKTYNIDNIVMCYRGFHFCVEMKDVIRYYDYNKDFVLFEVMGSGEFLTEEDKTVCSQIEIVRIVPKDEYTFPIPLIEYDKNGNIIHYKDLDGFEVWCSYDENNKLIHFKTSTGNEQWNTYNDNRNLIHCKTSTGYEEWNTYNDNRNLIHCKTSTGNEQWLTYDENNNVTHFKNSDGFEYWQTFDKNNNLIHFHFH